MGLTLSHESYENKELPLAGLKRRSQRGAPWPKGKQTPNRGHQARHCQQELKAGPGQQIGGKKETSVLQLQGKESYQQPISSEKDSEPK